jgi:hypothetical protein
MQGALLVDEEGKVIKLNRICETVDQRLPFRRDGAEFEQMQLATVPSQHEDN